MEQSLYKEAILCLMFGMADADKTFTADELSACVTMKDIFKEYTEPQIISLYNEYKKRFGNKGFSELAAIFVQQIPVELHIGTLSLIADIAVIDFDVDVKEGSFISLIANAMNITDTAVKTLLLASLSKKLLLNINNGGVAGLN